MTTKDISFIRFIKSKNPAVQECYSLKTRGLHTRLFYGFGLFKRNLKYQLSRKHDIENIAGNKQTTKQFSLENKQTILHLHTKKRSFKENVQFNPHHGELLEQDLYCRARYFKYICKY